MNSNKRNLASGIALVAFMALMVASPAFADGDGKSVGQDFFTSLQGMITGNIGFFLGLLLAVWGIWVWVVQQKTGAGVMMIIGGVLITLAPGLFNSARNLAGTALDTVGASTTGNGYTTTPGN